MVDGDTLDLADGTRVRIAIVDTPEVNGAVEPCGPEAASFTHGLVHGREVLVLRPTGAPTTDPFGRTLGEVVLAEEPTTSLNVRLAETGLGVVDERFTGEDPDLAERARAAQATAAQPACAAPPPSPRPEPEPAPAPAPAPGHGGRTDGGWACHPAYHECLPDGPDLDCKDVGHEVRLLGDADPYRLDGRSTTRDDGVGCESYDPWTAGATYPYY